MIVLMKKRSEGFQCPRCGDTSQVLDSRPNVEGSIVRRRRVCPECAYRFSTYETADHPRRVAIDALVVELKVAIAAYESVRSVPEEAVEVPRTVDAVATSPLVALDTSIRV